MLAERIDVNSFIRVIDSVTGIDMDCNISAVIEVSLDVVDERTYQVVSKNNPSEMITQDFIRAGFKSAYGKVYPNGVGYDEINESVYPVAEAIKEMLSDIMDVNGLAITELRFVTIELSQADRKRIEDFRAMMKRG